MRHPQPFAARVFAVTILLGCFAGCGGQSREQRGLSDSQVRELATKYRDEWLAKNTSEETDILARGAIVSVEKTPQGWTITFMTPSGHSPATPEGMHDYFLHVHITTTGELDRVVRGPDRLS